MDRRQFLSLIVAADGTVVLDSRRVFPLGLYHTPPGRTLREVKEAGFDVVHAAPTREALDPVREAGLKAWCTVGSDPARITETVKKLRDHPALAYWETEDEPSFQWNKPEPRIAPAVIRAAYALLKKLDPGRAVYLNHSPTNLVSTLQTYNPGGDLIATDVYPVIPAGIRTQYALWPDGRQGDLLNPYISQVGAYADKMRQVAGPRRAVLMVLQAFAWEMLRKEGDRDPKMVLYPTRDQMVFMALHSIVRGANGLKWWGLRHSPPGTGMWDNLVHVASVLRDLRGDLAARAVPVAIKLQYHDTGHSLDRGLEWAVRGSTWIGVNADPNPIDVTVHGLPRAPRLQLPPFGFEIRRLNQAGSQPV